MAHSLEGTLVPGPKCLETSALDNYAYNKNSKTNIKQFNRSEAAEWFISFVVECFIYIII